MGTILLQNATTNLAMSCKSQVSLKPCKFCFTVLYLEYLRLASRLLVNSPSSRNLHGRFLTVQLASYMQLTEEVGQYHATHMNIIKVNCMLHVESISREQ